MKNYFEDIYLEQYLTSEFTFAFELEGYASSNAWYKRNNEYWNDIYNTLGEENIRESHSIKDDSTLESTNLGDPFELASPIFSFKPSVISEVIKYLNWAVTHGVDTDETCGLHIHIGFPEKNKELLGPMMMWIILNLIVEEKQEMLTDLKEFKHWRFYNYEYSSFNDFDHFRYELYNNLSNEETIESFYKAIENIYNDEKYRVFRMHPQGTFEWRGVRGFLNEKMRDDIKEFFTTKLYPFVRWMSKVLDKNFIRIKGLTISQKEFYKYLIDNFNSPVAYEKKAKPFSVSMTPEDIKNYFVLFPNKSVFKKFRRVFVKIKDKAPFLLAGTMYDCKYNKLYIANGNLKECTIGNLIIDATNKNTLITDTIIRNLISEVREEKREYDAFFASSNVKKAYIYNASFANCLSIEEGTIEHSRLWRCDLENNSKTLRINNSVIDACNMTNLIAHNTTFNNCDSLKKSNVTECSIYDVDRIVGSNLYNCSFSDMRHLNHIIKDSVIQDGNIVHNKNFSFGNCKIENMTFIGCIIKGDNTAFINCTFKNIEFLGVSYTTFEDCDIEISGDSSNALVSNKVVFKKDGVVLGPEEAIEFNQ